MVPRYGFLDGHGPRDHPRWVPLVTGSFGSCGCPGVRRTVPSLGRRCGIPFHVGRISVVRLSPGVVVGVVADGPGPFYPVGEGGVRPVRRHVAACGRPVPRFPLLPWFVGWWERPPGLMCWVACELPPGSDRCRMAMIVRGVLVVWWLWSSGAVWEARGTRVPSPAACPGPRHRTPGGIPRESMATKCNVSARGAGRRWAARPRSCTFVQACLYFDVVTKKNE